MGDIHNSFGNRDTRFKFGSSFGIFIGCAMPNSNKFDQCIGTYPLLFNTLSYCVLGCIRNSGASTEYYTRLVVVTALLGRTCCGQNSLYRACNLHRTARADGVTALVCSKNRETTEEPCYYYCYYHYYYRNSARLEYESKIDTGNNRGDWNHFNIAQTILEQHTRKARK